MAYIFFLLNHQYTKNSSNEYYDITLFDDNTMLDFSLSYDIQNAIKTKPIQYARWDLPYLSNYIIYPRDLYSHMVSFGKSGQDLLDYKKIRETLSTDDIVKLICYNNYLSYYNVIFNLINRPQKQISDETTCYPIDQFFNTVSKLQPIFNTLSETHRQELLTIILPLVKTTYVKIKEKLSNESKDLSKNIQSEPDFLNKSFYEKKALDSSGYYVIVVEDDFLLSLKVRSKCQQFVLECLKTEIAHIGLDLTQQTYLYGLYLDLLQKQSKGILVI